MQGCIIQGFSLNTTFVKQILIEVIIKSSHFFKAFSGRLICLSSELMIAALPLPPFCGANIQVVSDLCTPASGEHSFCSSLSSSQLILPSNPNLHFLLPLQEKHMSKRNPFDSFHVVYLSGFWFSAFASCTALACEAVNTLVPNAHFIIYRYSISVFQVCSCTVTKSDQKKCG